MNVLPKLYIAISELCNLRCSYCYLSEEVKSQKVDPKNVISDFKALIQKLAEDDVYFETVVFHGAEPTMIPTWVYSQIISLYAQTYERFDTKFTFQTNGIKLVEFADELDEHNIKFSVSLDLVKELHDKLRQNTFDDVMQGITYAKNKNFEVSVLSTLTPQSYKYLDEINKNMKNLNSEGIKVFLNYVHTTDIDNDKAHKIGEYLYKNDMSDSYMSMNRFICTSRGNACHFLEFDLKGNVYACNQEFATKNSFVNIHNSHFDDVSLKRVFYYQGVEVAKECKGCEWYSYCFGGCPKNRVKNKSSDCGVRLGLLKAIKEDGKSLKDFVVKRER